MSAVSNETALGIARAYREIEEAEGLLEQVRSAMAEGFEREDIRDAFGRRRRALQLGVPSGSSNGHRLLDVAFELALPIIETHIAQSKAKIAALSAKARTELAGDAA